MRDLAAHWSVPLILALCVAWLAALCHERRIPEGLARHLRSVWRAWDRPTRAVMTVLLLCCMLRAQKPDGTNLTAGAGASVTGLVSAAGSEAGPPGAALDTAGGGTAQTLDGGGTPPAVAQWWLDENRDPSDADGDGLPDAWERFFRLNPAVAADAASDTDRDGLTALEEFADRCHPLRRDTDGDDLPDGYETARLPHLCPWIPDDTADADGDGLGNFHEMALGADPLDPDTNGDGRTDGEEADEGVDPALDPPDWAAYGTGSFTVRVTGTEAARRAGVTVGHILHSGVAERAYALAAGTGYAVTVSDLDPDNTNACSGVAVLRFDGATDVSGLTNATPATAQASPSSSGFTVTVPLAFPFPPGGGGGGGGTWAYGTTGTVTLVGIDLEMPYTLCCPVYQGHSFAAAARLHPEGATLPGWPSWSFSSGHVSPAAGALSVTAVFDESFTDCGSGASAVSLGAVTCQIGDRTVSRDIYPCGADDPEEDPGWDGQRFIAHTQEDSLPAELTYALAHGTNAVPFVWHGPSCDRVLSWEIGGNARFLADGQERTRVENAASVAVLPKGVTGQSVITAKVRIGDRQTVTDTVRFGTVSLRAEPVHDFAVNPSEPHINPCGLFVGDAAALYLEADGVDAEHLHWSADSGAVALGANVTEGSLIRQSVTGSAPGTDTVSAHVDHLWGAGPPQYGLTVYAPETPVPVHFMFVCDTNGNHAGSASEIPSLIAGVNYVYRQAGVRFEQASVAYTNNQEWYQYSENDVIQNEIVNSRIVTQGIEVYVVPGIATNVLGRNYGGQGLLIINTVSSYVFAHEIGHQCGWKDLYVSRTNVPPVSGPVSYDRLPLDWNNGPGPQEYYLRGLPHATLVRRLLMFGAAAGGTDIPAGTVYGLDKQDTVGLVTVGVQSMDRTPAHNQ